jgi:type VI secretion system protein ImpL
VGSTTQLLKRVEAAQRIRDMYFRAGSMDPELRFTITPEELDAAAVRFALDVDGQTVEYRHAAPRPVTMVWPGPRPGLTTVTFEERSGGHPNAVYQGPWGWLRFVESARLDRTSDVRVALTTSTGGHEARVILEAPSIRNPYASRDLREFRCE